MRGRTDGSAKTLTKERFLRNAVDKCPQIRIQIDGIHFQCLFDTGSNVSTMTENFFRDHLKGGDEDIQTTAKWLKLTAANKLPLPYLGYVELDIDMMGSKIPECGFLIISDDNTDETDASTLGIIGMNIVKRCKELPGISELDAAVGGEKLGTLWAEACLRPQGTEVVRKMSIIRVTGQKKMCVPASSVATIYARGFRRQSDCNTTMLLERGNLPLPSGLVFVPTVVSSNSHVFPVQVFNFSAEDV